MNERDLFIAALRQSNAADRAAFLEQACGPDTELRQRVEALLREHDQLGSFLEQPAPGPEDGVLESLAPDRVPTVHESVRERPGTQIGSYKLLEQIGEGGFGVVFMAEQTQPLRRKVALKVLKPGMDTRQVVARFEAERQALALMDHPNIATVLDGGATATGRPYFVMELVKGVTITQFCDQNQLSVRARLELFVGVCQAVQHAHQKGVIHRDLKPSNVLVASHDGVPVVKVIDFGIAKATGQSLTDKTLFTGFAQMVGTPLYMSPEQAGQSGLDVDTRSDIYSLGVILYELLTGTTPFDRERLRQAGYDELRRIICEEEPPRPSTRVSTLAQAATTTSVQRKSDPKSLSRLFRGELDWIVMRALEKDRNRRYETASAFAADVQRYLHDEPVLACPPSTGYRLRKWARRHKTGLRVAGAVFLLAVAALAVSTWQIWRAWNRESEQRQQAENDRDLAFKNMSLGHGALEDIYLYLAEKELPRDPQREEENLALLRNALRYFTKFAETNAGDPRVRYQAGKAYLRAGVILKLLGRYEEAEQALGQGIDLVKQVPADSPQWLEARHQLGHGHNERSMLCRSQFRFREAEEASRQAQAIHEELVVQSHGSQLSRADLSADCGNLSTVLKDLGRFAESEKMLEKSQELAEQLAREYPRWAHIRSNLAHGLEDLGTRRRERGDLEGALKLHQQAVVHQQTAVKLEPKDPSFLIRLCVGYSSLAATLNQMQKHAAALKICEQHRKLIGQLVRQYPRVPPYLHVQVIGYCREADALKGLGRFRDARKAYQEALPLMEKLVKEYRDHPEYQRNLGILQHDVDSLQLQRAQALERTGQVKEAEAAYREALALLASRPQARRNTAGHRQATAEISIKLGHLLMTRDLFAESEKILRQAVKEFEELDKTFPDMPSYRWGRARARSRLGLMFLMSGQLVKAEGPIREALTLQRPFVQDHPKVPEYRNELVNTLNGWGVHGMKSRKFKEAEEALQECLGLRIKLAEEFPKSRSARRDVAASHYNLGGLYSATNRYAQAQAAYQKARAIQEKLVVEAPDDPEFHRELASTFNNQGVMLRERGDPAGARPLFEQAIRHQRQALKPDPDLPRYRRELANECLNLADALRKLGDHAAAAKVAPDLPGIFPDDWRKHWEAAYFLISCAELARKDAKLPAAERAALARSYADQAREMLKNAAARCPDNYPSQSDLGAKLFAEVQRLERGGWNPHAIDALQKCIAIAEKYGAKVPAATHRTWLAGAYFRLAGLLDRAGQPREEEEAYRKALAPLEKLVQDSPENHKHRNNLGSALNNLALLLHDRGEAAGARRLLEQAIKHQRAALDLDRQNLKYRQDLARHYRNLAKALIDLGEHAEAAKAAREQPRVSPAWHNYRSAASLLSKCLPLVEKDPRLSDEERKAMTQSHLKEARTLLGEAAKRLPDNPADQHELARYLATSAEPRLRDPSLAVELATKATQRAPQVGGFWITLGIAHYRAGDWKATLAAFDQAMPLRKGGDSFDFFFLAMAHWQLGDKKQAAEWHHKGVDWMEKNKALLEKNKEADIELRRFRAEAATLLGVKEQPPERKPD